MEAGLQISPILELRYQPLLYLFLYHIPVTVDTEDYTFYISLGKSLHRSQIV